MSETTRRAVLTGAAGVGAAVALGACQPLPPGASPSGSPSFGGFPIPSDEPEPSESAGDPSSSAEPPSEEPTPSKSPTDEPEPDPTKSETAEPSPSKTQETTPANAIARTKDIPVGGGKVFEKEKVVVTQPTAGDFKAFSAVCTHQGCVVASVKQNVIKCPCHGAMFSATDGSVKGGPAPKALPSKNIRVEGDGLVLD